MKKLKKWIGFLMALCLLCSFGMISASATVEICPHGLRTFGDHQMNGGVGQYGNYRRYYYLHPGFNQYYQQWIRNGCSDWVNTTSGVGVTTSISIRETSNKSDAMFEFQNTTDVPSGAAAITDFFLYGEKIPDNDVGTRNWGWCLMRVNCKDMDIFGDPSLSPPPYLENYQKQAICMHELGHAMGLSHDKINHYNLMYPIGWACYAPRATAEECRLINHIYG